MDEPPKNIKYTQNRHIEDDDIGFTSPLYEIEIYNKLYLIAHGKEKIIFQKTNIYYFPIYIIQNKKVKCQIGVFEYESLDRDPKTRVNRFLDEDGDLDLNRLGDIVLYSFVNTDYITSLNADYKEHEIRDIESELIGQHIESNIITTEIKTIGVNDDDPLTLNIDAVKKSPAKIASEVTLMPGIFIANTNAKIPDMLMEETKEDAKRAKSEYHKMQRTTWIEKYMSNNDYDIVETAANGDCFFDAIRLAFQQIGQITTVEKLRAILANEATDETFQQYRNIYMGFVQGKMDIERQMKILKKTNHELKKRIENESDKGERDKILNDSKKVIAEYKVLQEKLADEMKMTEAETGLRSEFAFMKNLETLEQFREILKTTEYWADIWAINTLENILNIKIIPMGENEYDNDPNSVINCTQIDNDQIEKQGFYNPNFYIMMSYSGNHYRLITYKTKCILKFSEIPYDIKILVTIKCIEKNGGPYYLIQDFRNFRSKLGLDPDQGFLCDDEEDSGGSFDKNTVFVYHIGSDTTRKPGKGMKETIQQNRIREFADLGLKENKEWRKMLDDDYFVEISVDGLRWASATHYIEASKFRKRNPKFYETFSITEGKGHEDYGHNIEYVKAADSKTGIWVDKTDKSKIKKIRPDGIKKDPDYEDGRDQEEREKALYAKFSQNPDLKSILLLTKNAKLVKYIPKTEPDTDCILMKVRTIIQNEINRPERVDSILKSNGITL
jgi:hypothetical protein